jgi:hypothetical protein
LAQGRSQHCGTVSSGCSSSGHVEMTRRKPMGVDLHQRARGRPIEMRSIHERAPNPAAEPARAWRSAKLNATTVAEAVNH